MNEELAKAQEIVAAYKRFAEKAQSKDYEKCLRLLPVVQQSCIEAANVGLNCIKLSEELSTSELDFIAHRGYIFLKYSGPDDSTDMYLYDFRVKLPTVRKLYE